VTPVAFTTAHPRRGLRVLALACVLALAAGACTQGADGESRPGETPEPGGTLRIAAGGDVDSLDPGRTYTTFGFMLFRVMVRTLVSYAPKPGEAGNKLVPDLAEDTPTVSPDGLTYTFVLRPGVRYQPEIAAGREVRSEDFRYAIERGFYASVSNPYADLYFGDVFAGDEKFIAAPSHKTHIDGIDVSDPRKLVLRLKRPVGDLLWRLALPLAAPVPPEYAIPLDGGTESSYGDAFASSGPYQIERQNATVTGYVPGKAIRMVRNPNWDARTDPIRKAYPDRIEVTGGFADLAAATGKILAGEMDYNGDFPIPPEQQKDILSSASTKDLIHYNATSCMRYVSMNATIPPFDNPLVRKAVNYALDKRGMRAVRGGERTGSIATHVLLPGLPGFKEVGQKDYDPYSSRDFAGDVEKARDLMREAGYPTGLYTGPSVVMAGEASEIERRTGDVIVSSLEKIGIKVRREEHKRPALLARMGVQKSGIAIGASAAWCWDYPDAYTVIAPLFDGRRIREKGNTNYSQINSPSLNELIDKASGASGDDRAAAWAAADKFVMDLAPVVPWLWDSSPHLVSPRVVGYQFALSSVSMDLAVAAVRQDQE